MAQHDMNIADGSGAVVRSDVNGAIEALATCQMGATAPSPTWPLMWWGDTGNSRLKQRNAANTAWIDRGDLTSAFLQASDIAAGGSAGLLRADGDGSQLTGIFSSTVSAASKNLVGAYATASTATYTADELVLKNSLGSAYLASNVSFTVDITASGVNGLDAGSEASDTWYYIHAIYNGTSTNGLISTSATAPTLPSGYTYSALIGVIRNDSSGGFFPFLQNDRQISVQPHSVFAGVAGVSSFTSVSLSSHVPPIAKSCDGWFGHASINITAGVRVASDTAGLGAQALAAQSSGVVYDGYAIRMTFIDLKCPSQTIYWASVNVGTATHAMAIVGYQI
ncbi:MULTISPECIES: hypothetical protein [Thalassospira]|jgi:hypothetical protein|uniref:hypothetical protein n=1 Tax=Thalassospira TaxID=168934 RepID=UPI0008DD6E13|nr:MULTISPECIES: hypothetical protein [Thalassospira]MDM7975249.1 hypothetical protein [Thalassospira xiamenensis]OHZ00970.1 hypothetical protein BC440_09010 [Thalassospira sp. MIT1004]QPL37495.1 hypothetical protein IT971_09480 [Thalassospira sp. B30-1]